MLKSEKVLWGVSLAIQALLVIGALSLSWIFESNIPKQLDAERMVLAGKSECSSACQQSAIFVAQANQANREALRYSRKAIENFALAVLISTILQLVIFVRFVRADKAYVSDNDPSSN
jgi:hypothetical protein